MADMMSIIAANYKTVGTMTPSKTPYVAVDPTLYEGSWTGKYANQKTFKLTVSNIAGFRAKVQYQSDGTNKFQEVLIKDNAFRIGDKGRGQHLQRDLAFQPRVRRTPDLAHPAHPECGDDLVGADARSRGERHGYFDVIALSA